MAGAASLRILLVEDQADLAASIIDFLESEGHRLDYAADGRQGLDLALRGAYDVVLLDLQLPRLDGLAVCRELRATAERHLPILMLTARDTLDDKIISTRFEADDLVV
ncbi:MAG: response regulator, partial [Pseudomonadota bacterium]